MSFMGGAECSTAGNPLSQFTKHVQDDRSLQRDRLVNAGPNGALNGFRSANRGAAQDDVRFPFAFVVCVVLTWWRFVIVCCQRLSRLNLARDALCSSPPPLTEHRLT